MGRGELMNPKKNSDRNNFNELSRWVYFLLGMISLGLIASQRRSAISKQAEVDVYGIEEPTYHQHFPLFTTVAISALTYQQTSSITATLLSILTNFPNVEAQTVTPGYIKKFTTRGNATLASVAFGLVMRPNDNFVSFGVTPSPNNKLIMFEMTRNATLVQSNRLSPISTSGNIHIYSYNGYDHSTTTTDGGFAVGGYTTSYGTRQNTVFIAKWNSNAALSWVNMYEGQSVTGSGRSVAAMTPTKDNNIAMVVVGAYGFDFLKIGNDGAFLESFNLKTNIGSGTINVNAITIMPTDGSYIIAGGTRDGGQDTRYLDGLLIRMHTNGTINWAGGIGLKTTADEFLDVTITTDNGIAALGYTELTGYGHVFLLAKWKENGVLEWAKSIVSESTNHDGFGIIKVPAPNDGIIITGPASGDFYVSKYFNNGTFAWGYRIKDSSIYLHNVALNSQGEIIVVGSPGGSGSNFIVGKLDSSGKIYGCLGLEALPPAPFWKMDPLNSSFYPIGITITTQQFLAQPLLPLTLYEDVTANITESTPVCKEMVQPSPSPTAFSSSGITTAPPTTVTTPTPMPISISSASVPSVNPTDTTVMTKATSESSTSVNSGTLVSPTTTSSAVNVTELITTGSDSAKSPANDNSITTIAIAAGVSAGVFLSLLIGLLAFLRKRAQQNNEGQPHRTELSDLNPNRASQFQTSSSLGRGDSRASYGSAVSDKYNVRDLNTIDDLKIKYADITIGEELGRGAFGVVYKGRCHGDVVAIKQLTTANFAEKLEQDFFKELLTMAKLRSPNVVELYGASTDQKPYALIMEFVEGGTLFKLLHSTENIDLDTRLSIILDIARGLSCMHLRRVLHRDLKSPNILLTSAREAKLSDFGLSTVKSSSKQATSENTTVGSVCWMAPELFDRVPHSEKSDIYSFGMVMWEIFSRKIPYARAKKDEVINLIINGKKESKPEGTPEDIWQVITDCWHKELQQRPSANDVIERFTKSKDPLLSSAMSSLGVFSAVYNLRSGNADSDVDDIRRSNSMTH